MYAGVLTPRVLKDVLMDEEVRRVKDFNDSLSALKILAPNQAFIMRACCF